MRQQQSEKRWIPGLGVIPGGRDPRTVPDCRQIDYSPTADPQTGDGAIVSHLIACSIPCVPCPPSSILAVDTPYTRDPELAARSRLGMCVRRCLSQDRELIFLLMHLIIFSGESAEGVRRPVPQSPCHEYTSDTRLKSGGKSDPAAYRDAYESDEESEDGRKVEPRSESSAS